MLLRTDRSRPPGVTTVAAAIVSYTDQSDSHSSSIQSKFDAPAAFGSREQAAELTWRPNSDAAPYMQECSTILTHCGSFATAVEEEEEEEEEDKKGKISRSFSAGACAFAGK